MGASSQVLLLILATLFAVDGFVTSHFGSIVFPLRSGMQTANSGTELPNHFARRKVARPMFMQEQKKDEVSRFTQKQRLREEIESPFRKVRLFLVPASTASAALAAFISGTRLIAAYTGVKGYDVGDTFRNFLINMGAVAIGSIIYLNDRASREKDLVRIARSGQLASLAVRIRSESGREALLPLKTFRKTRRLAICVGGKEVLEAAREMATEGREALEEAGAIVVLVPRRGARELSSEEVAAVRASAGLPAAAAAPKGEGEAEGEAEAEAEGGLLPCLAEASGLEQWEQWLAGELEQAEEQGVELGRGFTVLVERTGFVKQKMARLPDWPSLAAETRRRNRPYGMPDFFPDQSTSK